MDVKEIDDILDELVRLGLIEEIWVEGEDSPRYRKKSVKGKFPEQKYNKKLESNKL